MPITVTSNTMEKGIRDLRRLFDDDDILEEMEVIGEQIIKIAIDSPIPSDTRQLANSGTTVVDKPKKTIIFGFNRVYAAFQDAPNQTKPQVIRPRRKTWLYVPVSRRGKTHRLGNNPESEGLVFGGFVRRVVGGGRRNRDNDADYILAKEVVIPVKGYGSALGPNHYFSGTIARSADLMISSLARRLEARLRKRFPLAGK